MALLADLISDGVIINVESAKIEWLMGVHTEPHKNEGPRKKGGKASTKSITGKPKSANIFGQLVNDVQAASATKGKFKPPTKQIAASSSSTATNE